MELLADNGHKFVACRNGEVPNKRHYSRLNCDGLSWAARGLEISQTKLFRQLNVSPVAVTQSVKRGEMVARERGMFTFVNGRRTESENVIPVK